MYELADIAITAVTCTLVITSVIGNSLVCAVVIRNGDMRIPINYLLVNLAIADIMYSAFLFPDFILRYILTHPDGMTGKFLCILLTGGNLAWVGASSSVVTLVAIAVERYYAVIYPHGHKGKLTIRKLKVVIPCCWIFSLLLNSPKFLKNDVRKEINGVACVHLWSDLIANSYFWAWFVFVVISLILMASLYSRVVYTLWVKRDDENNHAPQQQGVIKVRKRVTLMVTIVSAIFGICWPTDLLLHIVDNVSCLHPVVLTVTHTLIMFSSAVNPFAYALINQRFREKIKRMICCNSSRVHVAVEPQSVEMTNTISQPINRNTDVEVTNRCLTNQILTSDVQALHLQPQRDTSLLEPPPPTNPGGFS